MFSLTFSNHMGQKPQFSILRRSCQLGEQTKKNQVPFDVFSGRCPHKSLGQIHARELWFCFYFIVCVFLFGLICFLVLATSNSTQEFPLALCLGNISGVVCAGD